MQLMRKLYVLRMSTRTSTRRTAFIHVGTHKTGTTSIQSLLALNDAAFYDAGVFVPQTGRIVSHSAGHHNIAWELTGDRQFDRRVGTFASLLREVDGRGAASVCVTSEEFEFAHLNADALYRLRDGFRSIGYQTTIIVYLRPQADYLESLYAEIARAWNVDFTTFLDAIATTGMYGCSQFDYGRLVGAFAAVFGREQVLVRAYHASAPAEALLREFAGLIASRLDTAQLTFPERLNPMQSFGDVIEARARHLGCRAPRAAFSGQRFDPLDLRDIMRLILRFHASNEQISRAYGIQIPEVTLATLLRESIAELFRDRDSRYRKQLLRALIGVEDVVAA